MWYSGPDYGDLGGRGRGGGAAGGQGQRLHHSRGNVQCRQHGRAGQERDGQAGHCGDVLHLDEH